MQNSFQRVIVNPYFSLLTLKGFMKKYILMLPLVLLLVHCKSKKTALQDDDDIEVADFIEFAELLCHDALHREESCGAHFREEHQTALGEPVRDDAKFSYVAAWEYAPNSPPLLHKEPLAFEFVQPTMRTY